MCSNQNFDVLIKLHVVYIKIKLLLIHFRSFSDAHDLRWRCDDDAVLQPRPVPAERGVDDVVGVGRVLGQVRPRPEGQESGVQAHKKQQVRTLT